MFVHALYEDANVLCVWKVPSSDWPISSSPLMANECRLLAMSLTVLALPPPLPPVAKDCCTSCL